MRKIILLKFALMVAMTGLFTFMVVAQTEKIIDVDKDGDFHTRSALMVGGNSINPGMYRIYKEVENNEHFIVIRKVGMSNYWRSMGRLQLGDEVARLKTTVRSGYQQNRNTKIVVRRNAADERFAFAIWFRGENVQYLLATR